MMSYRRYSNHGKLCKIWAGAGRALRSPPDYIPDAANAVEEPAQ